MNARQLLRDLKLDAIYGLDWETFWAKNYTLRSMPTSEYIYDPRFKAHMVSVQRHDQKRARVMSPDQFRSFARTVNWSRTGVLGHHQHFDGLIESKRFNIEPAFNLDTLSMARPLVPVTVGHSLDALCKAFGLQGKVGGDVLLNTQGVETLSIEQYAQMAPYAGNDIEQTWLLFWKLYPYLPLRELFVIDATIKMFTRPRILIDFDTVNNLHLEEIASKKRVIQRLRGMPRLKEYGVTKADLVSNEKFADLLRAVGVEPPVKVSKSSKPDKPKLTLALSKQDIAFKRLLGHQDKTVRAIVRGRLRVKSSQLEKRAQRMARRSSWGPQPVYLNYSAAKTIRWGGSDKMNWQNFNRGSDLRLAVKAPPGYVFIIADQAQIEARLNAWYSGQTDIVEAFARGDDVYALTASKTYGYPVNKVDQPDERFVGKVQVLQLGYQCGGPRFADTLRLGQYGPPVDIDDDTAKATVKAWRQSNAMIVAQWRETNDMVKLAFLGKERLEHKHGIVYEGVGNHGYMHLPDGMSLRYDYVEENSDGGVSYLAKYKRLFRGGETRKIKRLYGGILVENRTQAQGRSIIAEQIYQFSVQLPKIHICSTTHDEVLLLVKKHEAERIERKVRQIMLTPPHWAVGLPFGVETQISDIYDKK